MKTPCLTVCLCVEDEDKCVVPLHEVAAGHVFGPQQRLRLILHGKDREALNDLVSSIQECCFHLVDEISVASANAMNYDVMLLILSPTHPPINSLKTSNHELSSTNGEDKSSFITYLRSIENFFGDHLNEHSKILILGFRSNIAASILSQGLGCLGGNQLLTFRPNQNDNIKNYGQYHTADTLCQTVSNWWAGNKDISSRISAGIKFFGKRNSTFVKNEGIFFSVPVDIVGEKTFKVSPYVHIDSEEVKKVVQEAETAFYEMRKKECTDKKCPLVYAQL